MNDKKLELFRTNVGSHMWKMNRPDSDVDMCVVYMMNSKDNLLGKHIRGKQTQEGEIDTVYYELGHMINHLIKGNVNFIWAVMSPIKIQEYKSSLRELREIVMTNLSKNCFNSINGLTKHNIHHFIDKGDRYSKLYQKKLNVIGRTLKFGINLLTWERCLFDKSDIKTDDELWDLKNKLNEAYKNSSLPEKTEREPFEKYLIKWRLHKMKEDGIIQ